MTLQMTPDIEVTGTGTTLEVESPEWWLVRLLKALNDKQEDYDRWQDYYDGLHKLSFFDAAVQEAFGNRFRRFTANFTSLVVDTISERLVVEGFRFKDDNGDKDLWDIWQENDLDGGSAMAHTEALIKGVAYAMVEPGAGSGTPKITIESPNDCIVEQDPRDRRKRRAALKRWVEDDGKLTVYVYLPTQIFKFRSSAKWTGSSSITAGAFARLETPGEDWPLNNRLGAVPVVPLPNRPQIKRPLGVSEVEYISSNQDLIAYYRVMAVIAARYIAWPQRWAKNVPIEIDAITGLPKQPFKGGLADLWVIEPYDAEDPRALNAAAQVEFGQFQGQSLAPFLDAIEWEVGAMGTIARVPGHMLLKKPGSIPPAAEQTKTSETGLTFKVGKIETYLGEGWEEVMRLSLKAKNDDRADIRTAETRWADTESRNEAVHTDAIVKLHAEGIIDDELAREEAGFSSEQIRRLKEREAAEERAAAKEPSPAPVPPETGLPVVPVAPGTVPAPTGPRMSPLPGGPPANE